MQDELPPLVDNGGDCVSDGEVETPSPPARAARETCPQSH